MRKRKKWCCSAKTGAYILKNERWHASRVKTVIFLPAVDNRKKTWLMIFMSLKFLDKFDQPIHHHSRQ